MPAGWQTRERGLTPTRRSPGSIEEDMWILRRLMFSFTPSDLWSLNPCCWFVPFDLLLLLLCCELLLNLILSSIIWGGFWCSYYLRSSAVCYSFHCSNNSEAILCIIRCVHEYEKWLQTMNMICFSPDIALYIQKENSESMYHVSYYWTWFFLSRCTLHSTKKHCALALSSYIVCPFFSSWAVADAVMRLNTLSTSWYGYWTSASAIVQLIL